MITGTLGSQDLSIILILKLKNEDSEPFHRIFSYAINVLFSSKINESEFQLLPLEKKVDKKTSIMWGTYRSLINNAVMGVSKGHEKILELSGVGFRANLKGEILNLQIGFSHDVNFKIPKEVKITVEKQTVIKINGVDKELVSKIAADIKNFKPVEPYKAKGIKEKGQFVLRKEGKKK